MEAAGSTPDAAKGEINEDEALLEEEEGQTQATATLKKRKRVKEKSPIRTSLLKTKGPESASHAQDCGEVSINSTCFVCIFLCLYL